MRLGFGLEVWDSSLGVYEVLGSPNYRGFYGVVLLSFLSIDFDKINFEQMECDWDVYPS